MAEQSFTGKWIAPNVHQTTWANLSFGDTAAPQSGAYLGNKNIFITGDVALTTIVIQGSNAPTTTGSFFTLTDTNGNELSFTTTGLAEILERPRWIKPVWGVETAPDFTAILTQTGNN